MRIIFQHHHSNGCSLHYLLWTYLPSHNRGEKYPIKPCQMGCCDVSYRSIVIIACFRTTLGQLAPLNHTFNMMYRWFRYVAHYDFLWKLHREQFLISHSPPHICLLVAPLMMLASKISANVCNNAYAYLNISPNSGCSIIEKTALQCLIFSI